MVRVTSGSAKEGLPEQVDVVVVGSGAGGIVGAITAAHFGLSTIIIEKCDQWGGTTAHSGGGAWIPGNPLMREAGIEDSLVSVLTYLDQIVGDVGSFTSWVRKSAIALHGGPMVAMLRDLGFEWLHEPQSPDYYAEFPGTRS